MRKRLIFLFMMVSLAACHVLQPSDPSKSVWFRVPVDSRLLLLQQLRLAPYQNRMYFQDGAAMFYARVNPYLPYCALSMAQKRTVEVTVEPESFRIKKVYRQLLFDLALVRPYLAGLDRGNGDGYQVKAFFMELQSDKQPDVEALICAHWSLPQGSSNLTLNDIYRSLGEVFSLELLEN